MLTVQIQSQPTYLMELQGTILSLIMFLVSLLAHLKKKKIHAPILFAMIVYTRLLQRLTQRRFPSSKEGHVCPATQLLESLLGFLTTLLNLTYPKVKSSFFSTDFVPDPGFLVLGKRYPVAQVRTWKLLTASHLILDDV